MPGTYYSRPLARKLLASSRKVVVLEGARAVGKTSLMRKQIVPHGYSYQTLANQNVYETAKGNITAWVESLRLPAIIDEAQRLDGLPLAIKERADALPGPGPQFILTGSASLNTKGLDNQNPLTRRSARFSLSPLTERELARVDDNLVDSFWNETPNPTFHSSISRQDILSKMANGGFPEYALSGALVSSRERMLSIKDDIDNVLGDSILPGEYLDKGIAQAILNHLLCLPGNILNISKISKSLEYDNRTVERYISIFVRRYLIHYLPNLAYSGQKQNFTRSKIHPVDTSFSYNQLISHGIDPLKDPVVFGWLFESFVINQFVASVQWAESRPQTYYWRQAGSHPSEVDLVLLNDNKLIGIEVKSADHIDEKDFRGLRALAEDPRFYRGYVVYTGDAVIEQDEALWAIPVAALWERGAFSQSHPRVEPGVFSEASRINKLSVQQANDTAPASVFLSYRRRDNEHLNGAIIELMDQIAQEYEFAYGESIDLFIDQRSINWGADWQRHLDTTLDSTTFIVPAVTPGYINSAACRSELERFYSGVKGRAGGHVLSLLWQPYKDTRPAETNPSIVEIIERYQYVDVSELSYLEPTDRAYRAKVADLAKKLHAAIQQDRESIAGDDAERLSESQTTSERAPREQASLLDRLASMQDSMGTLQNELGNVTEEFRTLASSLNKTPVPTGGDLKRMQAWALVVEQKAKDPASRIKRHLSTIRASWNDIKDAACAYIELLPMASNLGLGESAAFDFRTQLVGARQSFSGIAEITPAAQLFSLLGYISPRLAFIGEAFEQLSNLGVDMQNGIDDLIERIDAIGPTEGTSD